MLKTERGNDALKGVPQIIQTNGTLTRWGGVEEMLSTESTLCWYLHSWAALYSPRSLSGGSCGAKLLECSRLADRTVRMTGYWFQSKTCSEIRTFESSSLHVSCTRLKSATPSSDFRFPLTQDLIVPVRAQAKGVE